MSLMEKFRQVPLLQSLSDQQLRDLASLGQTTELEAGRVVFGEGEAATQLYVILAGRVRVFKAGRAGEQIEISTAGPGQVFGEMAVLDGSHRSASVVTLSSTVLFVIDREPFRGFLDQSPGLSAALLVSLSGRMRSMDDQFIKEILSRQTLELEMERRRSRSLAEMVAGVAHELNTPLGIVNTAASFINESLRPELVALLAGNTDAQALLSEIAEATQLIERNIERANRLVRSFKSLSVGQVQDIRRAVDLICEIQDTVRLYKPQARQAGLDVRVCTALPKPRREWVGFPGYLSQIVLNLLSNAERYAYPDGLGGRVEILVDRKEVDGEPWFTVTVKDYGRGIASSDLPNVFEAFYTTGRDQGGTGLGLAIVRNLVSTALRGSVEIESEAGLGTEVIVTIPQRVPDEAEQAGNASRDGAETEAVR